MLKHKWSKFSEAVSGLWIFDKLNILIVILFFVGIILFPIAYIAPVTSQDSAQAIRLVGLEHRKTSIGILIILVVNTGMSINGKFKSLFLKFTGIGNDIYARFFLKGTIFFLLIFFGEIILHLRSSLTQTINIGRGYYYLGGLLLIGLVVDYLFLQRNYKLNVSYNHRQTTINQDYNYEEQPNPENSPQSFKNLFDE